MDPKHTNKDIEAGLEAPPSYTPPRDEARSEGKGGRCLKRLGVLAFTFLFLFLVIGRGVGVRLFFPFLYRSSKKS
jgi:hypothetical protein